MFIHVPMVFLWFSHGFPIWSCWYHPPKILRPPLGPGEPPRASTQPLGLALPPPTKGLHPIQMVGKPWENHRKTIGKP